MKLKSVFTILMAAVCLSGSLSAQNKTSNSKETKMGKSLVVYFSLAGEQYNVGNIKDGTSPMTSEEKEVYSAYKTINKAMIEKDQGGIWIRVE